MTQWDADTRTVLAGEYVTGVLRGAARARFERLLTADFALRREVERWQEQLAALAEVMPERRPPPRVWRGLCKELGLSLRVSAGSMWRPLLRPWVVLWRSLVFWRLLGTVSLALLLVSGAYVYERGGLGLASGPGAEYVAVLGSESGAPAWLVRLQAGEEQVLVRALDSPSISEDRSFQLWLLPGEGRSPRSLGVIPARGSAALPFWRGLADLLARAEGLSVTLEPAGGTLIGQPTGEVVARARLIPPGSPAADDAGAS